MANEAVLSSVSAGTANKQVHHSFLKGLGHLGLDCVTKVLPFLTREAQKCEPVINLLFPLEGPVFTSVVNSVCLAEVAGQTALTSAAPQQGGQLKFEAVWNTVGPQLVQIAQAHGFTGDDAVAKGKTYIEAIIQILNGPTASSDPAAVSASKA